MTNDRTDRADRLRELALALPGTVEVQHFERRAFRARRIFATLPPAGNTANILLPPDEQVHWCGLLPEALSPVKNKWGAHGWTEILLARTDDADLSTLLRSAWLAAGGVTPASGTRASP